MKRRLFLFSAIFCAGLFLTVVWSLSADEWKPRHDLVSHTGVMNLSEPPPPGEVFFPGPDSPSDQPAWLEGLKSWRSNRRILLRYTGNEYSRPELEWTQHVFSQVQLLVWDRSLYDAQKHDYTVERFLAETENRIGPIDAVLIWHVYPNLGVDDRNQFDLLRDLPGGIVGLRRLVEQFHNHGVKVFFPFLAWDTGTRPEGSDPSAAMSQLIKDIGADGINFDTLESVPFQFHESSDKAGQPIALEPQFQPRDDSVAWSTLSWNDWVTWEGKPYPFVPMVSKNKWMESRHMANVTDRFTRDKTDSLQHAFFNGQGYATLENLWGFWYGDTPHDAEAVLRFTRIERTFARNLTSADWQPHTPTLQPGVFASKFPTQESTLWSIVNRNEYDVVGEQLTTPYKEGERYYDLWNGEELQPVIKGNLATLSFTMEGRGFGAVLATHEPNDTVNKLLAVMADRSKRPLSSYSRNWKAVSQQIVDSPATKTATGTPTGMIRIPAADYNFEVRGIEIEGGNGPGVDVQYPWDDMARRTHRHRIHLHSFFIDRVPVT